MLCYQTAQQGCSEEITHENMRKRGSLAIIATDKLPSYALLFVKLALLTGNFAAVDQTIDAKTHICHFDDENERCSVSKR